MKHLEHPGTAWALNTCTFGVFRNMNRKNNCYIRVQGYGGMWEKASLDLKSQERLQKGGDTLSSPWIRKERYQAFERKYSFQEGRMEKMSFIYVFLWILPFFHWNHEGTKDIYQYIDCISLPSFNRHLLITYYALCTEPLSS